jgi:hypothetical protein
MEHGINFERPVPFSMRVTRWEPFFRAYRPLSVIPSPLLALAGLACVRWVGSRAAYAVLRESCPG